jgi:hypothetical protein
MKQNKALNNSTPCFVFSYLDNPNYKFLITNSKKIIDPR